jgi:hypothetical protein
MAQKLRALKTKICTSNRFDLTQQLNTLMPDEGAILSNRAKDGFAEKCPDNNELDQCALI